MEKLTKTQSESLNKMKSKIDLARNNTYEQVMEINYKHHAKSVIAERRYEENYKNEKLGIVLANASSNTLRSLERKGYIKIITDGGSFTDKVKVLNY